MGKHSTVEAVPRRAWLVLAVVSVCSSLNPLSSSVLFVAFPALRAAFPDTSAATLSWVISLYAIVSAATLIVGGVLADRLGRKRILLIGAAGFALASFACGLAPNAGALIALRAPQAFFSSLLTPAGAALVLREFPTSRRATAIAAWASAGSVAAGLGPTLGAVLVDVGGWRWTFWVTIPFAMIGLVAIPKLVPEMRGGDTPVPDLVSAPLILVSVSGVILGVSQSSRWGWTSATTIASIVIGVLVGAWLLVRSIRHPRPMLDLRLFEYRSFRIANIASILFGTSFFAVFSSFPRFTQEVWHYDVRAAGLLLLPIPVAGILFNGYAGRFADLHGHRPVMILGGVSQLAGGLVLFVGLTADRDITLWLLGLGLVGFGTSLTWPAIFGNTVMGVPPSQYAAVTSINQTAQRMATAAGTAVAVTLIGESSGVGVGTYRRVFLLTAIGGLTAAIIGWFMTDRATPEPIATDPLPTAAVLDGV